MHKKFIVIQGPVETRSGYGDHTRDLAYSLIESGKYEVGIISVNWGNTSFDALEDTNEKDIQIKNAIITDSLTRQPDIFIQVSVPNEFRPIGKYASIGITAGIETTQCAPEWIDGINRMDHVIVPSEFSKQVFMETKYNIHDKQSGAEKGMLEVTTPITVLFEGIDTDIFRKIDDAQCEESIATYIEKIEEDFVFLSVGHWLNGDIHEDRKNISGLIYNFIQTFNGNDTNKPALLLKTSGATFSIRDRERMTQKINAIKSMFPNQNLPNIYLLHGNLTKNEMNSLYNHSKIKAMVSYTKGEGFGRPLLEFAATGKPVLASNFSGHKDFLNPALHTYLPGELREIHKSAVWDGVLVSGSSWFAVDYTECSKLLSDLVKSYKSYKINSTKFLDHVKKWSLSEMSERFVEFIESRIDVPANMEIKLPSLTKVE
jgi:glycosyltransferase involved in cell wall biosynthesis